jgi:hypothetical protein
VGLLLFISILHLFAQSILLTVAWSFIGATAGSSFVANIAVLSVKVAAVVFSDVGR